MKMSELIRQKNHKNTGRVVQSRSSMRARPKVYLMHTYEYSFRTETVNRNCFSEHLNASTYFSQYCVCLYDMQKTAGGVHLPNTRKM